MFKYLFLFIIFYQFVFASLDLTKKEKEWLENNPINRVAIMSYWPHNSKNESLHTDVLKLINIYAGTNIVPVVYDAWKDGFDAAKLGEDIHGIMGLSWSREREEKYFYYTPAYNFTPSYLVVRNDSDISKFEDIKDKTIYLKENEISHKMMNDKSPTTKIIDLPTVELMYEKLSQTKEADAMIAYFIDEKELLKYDLKIAKIIYDRYGEVSIGVNHKYPELYSIIKKAYKIIPKTEISKLREKDYLDEEQIALKLTDKEKQWIKSHPVINVGGESDWAPFDFVDESGNYVGLSKDYLDLISQKSGLKFNYSTGLNWESLLKALENKQIDILPAIYFTNKRAQMYNFSIPYLTLSDYFFTKNDYPRIDNINQLNGKKIAVIKGYELISWLKKNYPNIKLVEKENIYESLKCVETGDCDTFIGDNPSTTYTIEKYFLTDIILNNTVKQRAPVKLYMATRKDYTILKDIIDKTIKSFTNAEKKEVSSKWMTLVDKKTISLTIEEENWLAKKKAIKYSYEPRYEPVGWEDELGKHTGVLKDILALISQKSGMKFEDVKSSNWSDALQKAKNGDVDAIVGIAENKLRKEFFQFTTNSIYNAPGVVVTKKDDDSMYLDIKQMFENKSIAVTKNGVFEDYMKRKYPLLKFALVDSVDEGFERVSDGDFDAYITNATTAQYYLKTKGYTDLRIASKVNFDFELKIAVNETLPPEVISIINKSIDLITKKELDEISHKWNQVYIKNSTDWKSLYKYIMIICLIILAFIIHNIYLKKKINKSTHDIEIKNKELAHLLDTFDKNVMFSKTDLKGMITDVSEAFCKTSGYKKEELIGKAHSITRHPDMKDNVYKEIWESLKNEKSIVKDILNIRPDGSSYWLKSTFNCDYDLNGKLVGYSAIRQDISDRKKVEELSKNLEMKVSERTSELVIAMQEIEEIHKRTKDSIEYASLIQSSLIPEQNLFRKYFEDFFTIWHPKDIVGGDIYLFEQLRIENGEGEVILMVIDCTGHGVPGAFVTMIVKAIERQIIAKINHGDEIVSPAKILSIFNRSMKHLLRQDNNESVSNAGFDGGILYYNKKNKLVKFSGASTPIFYTDENDDIVMIKGDRHSIGYRTSDVNYEFTEHEISVKDGMKIYLTTDGYLEQNGGEKSLPYGKRRFQKLLKEYVNESMADQQEVMLMTLNEYQGNERRNDDITVIGLKI